MLEFRTQGYNPYAVKYSPYYDSRIAVASSANFGIVGNGRVFCLGLTARGVEVEATQVPSHLQCQHSIRFLTWLTLHDEQLRHQRLPI